MPESISKKAYDMLIDALSNSMDYCSEDEFTEWADIANASSHSGRRSGLTALADKGVSVRVLMAIAGHSQLATTQRYIDLRPSVVKAAVELV